MVMKTWTLFAVGALAASCASCRDLTVEPVADSRPPKTPNSSAKETDDVTTLLISKKLDGAPTRIGAIAFAEGAEPVLTVEVEGQDADALRKAWNETAAIEKLPMSETRPVEGEGGKRITQFGTVLVPRGNQDYKWAVYDYLERQYGYQVDVQR